MNPIMDWHLLVLCEYEFIHHHCTNWILQQLKFWIFVLIQMSATCIMHYAPYRKISNNILHCLSFWILTYLVYFIKQSKEDNMKTK
jgi:hypothetical protein